MDDNSFIWCLVHQILHKLSISYKSYVSSVFASESLMGDSVVLVMQHLVTRCRCVALSSRHQIYAAFAVAAATVHGIPWKKLNIEGEVGEAALDGELN